MYTEEETIYDPDRKCSRIKWNCSLGSVINIYVGVKIVSVSWPGKCYSRRAITHKHSLV